MSHTVIKFICHFDEDCQDFFKKCAVHETVTAEPISLEDAKSWHLTTSQGDGGSTLCGQVYADYLRDIKTMERGGITCPDCLSLLKELKSIKL